MNAWVELAAKGARWLSGVARVVVVALLVNLLILVIIGGRIISAILIGFSGSVFCFCESEKVVKKFW